MTSVDPAMCLIKAPSGEANYLLEIRQFLWNHRSEKETDLVIISGKEPVKVHQAIILPLSDHPIDLFPPSCPCTKPALCLPPFPDHVLTAAVEILYTGKTTMMASRDDHVKMKEVFSLLKIKVDIIAGDFEGGNIGREHDSGGPQRVIVKIELTDSENNNIGQDEQKQDDHSCYINDVKGMLDNDAMRNISSSYLSEVTGEFHYHERRNSLELHACQNDKNVDGSHSPSSGYLDEFSNFISLNSGSRSSFTIATGASGLELSGDVGSNYNTDKIVSPTYNVEKDVKTTMSHDTDEIWNDLKMTKATEGYEFRPSEEEPTSPPSRGPLAKLRPRKRKAKETDDAGVGLDGILSMLKSRPGNKKQKISTTTESSKKYLKIHNNSKHGNIFHNCDHCDYKTRWKFNLKTHIESVHEKIFHECNECRYKTTRKDHLKMHIKRKHGGDLNSGYQGNGRAANEEISPEGKKSYYCNQCEYKSTLNYRLKQHIDRVHKNIFSFYRCDHCDYKTIWKFNPKTHIESIHEKISYECNECLYKTTRKDHLKMHIKRRHAGDTNSGYQGTARSINKETFSRELTVHAETSSNFQNLSQDQAVGVSSKSTNSDDNGPVDDTLREKIRNGVQKQKGLTSLYWRIRNRPSETEFD